jgi:hypothetical protein
MTLTATGLANAAGYESFSSANEKYGRLGRMLAEYLEWDPVKRPDGSPIWTTMIATGGEGDWDDGQFRWVMRTEVAEALRRLNRV